MHSFFITGTDTDVGKTLATALLTKYFSQKGMKTFPYKPIQSGAFLRNGERIAPDVDFYETVTKLDLSEDVRKVLLLQASSPHLAAKAEHVVIDSSFIHDELERLHHYDVVFVEGAGGLIVPITEDGYCMINLIQDLSLPVLLVARAGLGTINHTVLSIMAMKQFNISIAGVIFNRIHEEDLEMEVDNAHMITQLTGVPVLGTIPHFADINALSEADLSFMDEWNLDFLLEGIK